jgi:hypothetical protein
MKCVIIPLDQIRNNILIIQYISSYDFKKQDIE